MTLEQWKAVTGTAIGTACAKNGVGAICPAEGVSWDDIRGSEGFIAKLNAYLTVTGQAGAGKYRLPTEAEWERAARGGTQTRFSFGDALAGDDGCGANPEASPYVWWCNNSGTTSHSVGAKLANQFGLFDMHGNVWEWVEDSYGPYPSGAVSDPTGPPGGEDRVMRGGGWYYSVFKCRSAIRSSSIPFLPPFVTGFRLARSL